MLKGEGVVLRARTRADVGVLYPMDADPEMHMQVSYAPYRPQSLDDALRHFDEQAAKDDDTRADFVIEAGGKVAGDIGLFMIDTFNRSAHLGIALLPDFRGKGLGVEAMKVLVDYAFRIRALHRVSLETLSGNFPMARAAKSVGFIAEGVLRRNAWVDGGWQDTVLFALLEDEWRG